LTLYIDGDACPVKDEVYRIALKNGLKVYVACHSALRAPAKGRVEVVRVKAGLNAADDWIAERASEGDVVVTADIPLADRCLKRGARVVAPDGRVFTEDSIGQAMAGRDLSDQLRQMGVMTGGPAPFGAADRRRFVAALSRLVAE
jgi:uncharacterized protein YaiI (UPF0178 family)